MQAYYRLFIPHVLILKIFAGFCAKIQRDQNMVTQLKVDHGVFAKIIFSNSANVYFLMVGEHYKHAAG